MKVWQWKESWMNQDIKIIVVSWGYELLHAILLNKIAKVFFYLACNLQPQLTRKYIWKKNLAIHLYTNDEILWIDICHNFDISSPCNSLSLSFISSARYVMSDLQNLFFIFSLSLHHSNDENVSHFYCCTNRHLFLQYIYETEYNNNNKKKPHFALTMWIFFIIVNRDVDGWNGMSMT